MCLRNNFNSLYGALKKGLESYLLYDMERVIFYFGNIDVRHHLMRQEDPIASTFSLYDEYVSQVRSLIDRKKIKRATIVEPLPIEHEERKIPKMGRYKHDSFYGGVDQRIKLREQIKIFLRNQKDIDTFKWPTIFEKLSGEEFAKQYMEKPAKSVHLSRSGYYWDFENNKINKEHE
jgi:hypothetical protein